MTQNKFILGLVLLLFVSHIASADNGEKNVKKTKSTNQEKGLAAGCSPGTASTYLEYNNVKCIIKTNGSLWTENGDARYEVPKGSNKHSNYASSVWIGGTDVNDQLRFAGVMYNASGDDYWPGPLVKSGAEIATVSSDVCKRYDKQFAISKNEVKEFRAYFEAKANGDPFDPNYSIPLAIMEWPAHGPVADGAYDWDLAPYRDLNGNDIYEPELGEYPRFEFEDDNLPCGTTQETMIPRLYGDMALWWVYNDNGNVHTESGGAAIGMELRGQAFAFASNDELNNATFYNFEVINRSTYTLKNAYFAVFTDADIGESANDLCGCEVGRGLGYMYNKGSDGDGSLNTYGANPPAIGIDFFEGPFMDPSFNNADRPSAYIFDEDGNRTEEINPAVGPETYYNGSINGLNFGDGVPNNERWGMRRFLYFDRLLGSQQNDPSVAIDYYNYLTGRWKDNSRMTYGGNGFGGDGPESDFMFPGTSDITDWGTQGVIPLDKNWKNTQQGDKRFVHSAGPFTLQPGAVNYITTGVIWARSYKDGDFESVKLVIQADDKAQRLFENCFVTIDGPDAPELEILEGDQSFIFNIWNKQGSNNFEDTPEDYEAVSPFIACPVGATSCDKTFKFEGYIVYQLKDNSVSAADIENTDLAKPVFQCDINNEVGSIINFEWDGELQVTVPRLKVEGANAGIKHSFELEKDYFAKGTSTSLVNHKTYYYIAIAYSYNNYKNYDPTDPNSLDGQKEPFLVGRNNIKKYEVIPHLLEQNLGGTVLNSSYGQLLPVTQLDGYGTGGNSLELEEETIERIMSGEPWKVDSINYKIGHAPIKVTITNPHNVKAENYILKFENIVQSNNGNNAQYIQNGFFGDASWYLLPLSSYDEINGYDTIYSSQFISVVNEQQITYNNEMTGIAIEIAQGQIPGVNRPAEKNGVIEASIEQNGKQWLGFVADEDLMYNYQLNWIRAGKFKYTTNASAYDDHSNLGIYFDPDQYYEGILNGRWALTPVVASDAIPTEDVIAGYKEGVTPKNTWKEIGMDGGIWRYGSVDIIITKDKSKWTRCPVVETSSNNYVITYEGSGAFKSAVEEPAANIGGKLKYRLRASASVDKDGNSDPSNVDVDDPNNPNFIGSYGMGWFPGYAIDVETGERLNMMFGEDSHRGDNNGQDMLWNPTPELATPLFFSTNGRDGELIKGGKHYIYVMGRNTADGEYNAYTIAGDYDYGKKMYNMLVSADNESNSLLAESKARRIYKNATWVSMPILNQNAVVDVSSDPYAFIQGDVKVKIRMANPYRRRIQAYKIHHDTVAQNGNFPMYRFSTFGYSASTGQTEVAKNALDLINVVPNPYYAYSEYETSPIDHKVKFTNLPNTCTISIYNVGGTLVRRFEKDNNLTYLDWDLKNEYGISIAGGVYIVHIESPELGEVVLKWFGSLRPIDLNNF